jgi:hypothetical protein
LVSKEEEADMAETRGAHLVTLGWQVWAIVVVVLALVLLFAAWALTWW